MGSWLKFHMKRQCDTTVTLSLAPATLCVCVCVHCVRPALFVHVRVHLQKCDCSAGLSRRRIDTVNNGGSNILTRLFENLVGECSDRGSGVGNAGRGTLCLSSKDIVQGDKPFFFFFFFKAHLDFEKSVLHFSYRGQKSPGQSRRTVIHGFTFSLC